MHFQVACDLDLVVTRFAQDVNLVSLFRGKLLWFSHSNAPFDLVVRRELRKLSQLALLIYIKSCVSNLKPRYDDFVEFDEKNPTREEKYIVPIDCEEVAKELNADAELVFSRLYYRLNQEYGYSKIMQMARNFW